MRINPSSESLTPVTNTSIDDEHIPDSKKSLVDNSSPFRSWTKYYSSDSLPQSIELTKVLIHTVIARLATTFLNLSSWTMKVIKWKPTSSEELEIAETKLLSCKTLFVVFFIIMLLFFGRLPFSSLLLLSRDSFFIFFFLIYFLLHFPSSFTLNIVLLTRVVFL